RENRADHEKGNKHSANRSERIAASEARERDGNCGDGSAYYVRPSFTKPFHRRDKGTEKTRRMSIFPVSLCPCGECAAWLILARRLVLELLPHPLLERAHVLFTAEEVPNQIIRRNRSAGLQHCVTIAHGSWTSEQVRVVELTEEVLGNDLVPQ